MNTNIKGRSMRSKLVLVMVFVVIAQGLMLVAAIFALRLPEKFTHSEITQFEKSVETGKTRVQDLMVVAQAIVEENAGGVSAAFDYSSGKPVLPETGNIASTLIGILNKNNISGAFVLYNPNGDAAQGQKSKAGLYLRKQSPRQSFDKRAGTSIELLRGSGKYVEGTFIPKSSHWSQEQSFENPGSGFSPDFFNKPVSACSAEPNASTADFGYWSEPFNLGDNDYGIITFTIPLKDNAGKVFGVFGIEISADYFEKTFASYSEFGNNDCSIVLGVDNGADSKLTFLNKSPLQDKINLKNVISYFDEKNLFKNSNTYNVDIKSSSFLQNILNNLVGYKTAINTNERADKLSGQKWDIYFFTTKSLVFPFSMQAAFYLLFALFVSLFTAVIIAIILGLKIVKPITQLSHNLKEINPEDKEIKLVKTNYREIDELAHSIELLSSDVAQISSRMTKIISLVNLPLGAFEIKNDRTQVYLTDSLFALLGIKRGNNSNFVDIHFWNSFIEYAKQKKHPSIEDAYNISFQSGNLEQWVRIKSYEENSATFGIVMDVTEQVKQVQRLEYERDYDVLTKLLNRRGFKVQAINMLEKYSECVNALLMFDLDNLKCINDTYGHDWGDRYIKMAGNMLTSFNEYNAVVARMSGDEFYVLLYGYDSKQQILSIVNSVYTQITSYTAVLPDDSVVRLQASCGIAFYPYDAQDFEELLKCADFAMYEVKNSTKGSIKEYNSEKYKQNSYIFQKNELLNDLLDNVKFNYVFQPVVDVLSCSVFGYEALVRSEVGNLSSIEEILNLAKVNGKLFSFESEAHSCIFNFLENNYSSIGDTKLFVHVISPSIIKNDFSKIRPENKAVYASCLIYELLEQTNQQELNDCIGFINANHINISADGYETYCSGKLAEKPVLPKYLKISPQIIHGIEGDENKRTVFKNIVEYAHNNNIKTIASGIETFEELQTVVKLGADYLQGNLIGMPASSFQPLSPQLTVLLQKLTGAGDYENIAFIK